MGCKRLKSIDFGQGIVDIGNDYSGGVFQGCENLEKVVLPSQIKSIFWLLQAYIDSVKRWPY